MFPTAARTIHLVLAVLLSANIKSKRIYYKDTAQC